MIEEPENGSPAIASPGLPRAVLPQPRAILDPGFASLSMHMGNRLRLLGFDQNAQAVVRDVINQNWPRGIRSERPAKQLDIDTEGDKVRFIGAPMETVQAAVEALALAGLLDKANPYVDRYYHELKMKGWPWLNHGHQAVDSRLIILKLMSVLEKNGWFVYASLDQRAQYSTVTHWDAYRCDVSHCGQCSTTFAKINDLVDHLVPAHIYGNEQS
ncbi:hypothetical protein BJ170DRAFT_684792 [Xylariales sp. AK1849]|nr:hypothetical protein BJ170DRAFT_684792 [Xylariales sp. AK1849]